MPISPAGTSRGAGRPGGFTLLEVTVTLAVLALAAFLVMPAFQNLVQRDRASEAQRLRGVLRLLRNEAILTRTRYQVVIDLKGGRYHIERQTLDDKPQVVTEPRLLGEHRFPAGWTLKRMLIYGSTNEPLVERPVPIVIDASGFIDPFLLQFEESGEPWTLREVGWVGRIELVPGHVTEFGAQVERTR
jgi:prepilin-type N-terminal cleavage/methylation domain-containing protein